MIITYHSSNFLLNHCCDCGKEITNCWQVYLSYDADFFLLCQECMQRMQMTLDFISIEETGP